MNTHRHRSLSPRETAVLFGSAAFVLASLLALIIGIGVYDPPIHVQLALIAVHAVCIASGISMFSIHSRRKPDLRQLRPEVALSWAGVSLALLAALVIALIQGASPWIVLALLVAFSTAALFLPATLNYIERRRIEAEYSSPKRVLERMNRIASQYRKD